MLPSAPSGCTVDDGVGGERAVEVREGVLADLVLAPRDVEPVGLDRQQHQRLARVAVEAVEHARDLLGARGVQEALLLEGASRVEVV